MKKRIFLLSFIINLFSIQLVNANNISVAQSLDWKSKFNNFTYTVKSETCPKKEIQVFDGEHQSFTQEHGNCLFSVRWIVPINLNPKQKIFVVTANSSAGGSLYEVHGYIYDDKMQLLKYFPPTQTTSGENIEWLEAIAVDKLNRVVALYSYPGRYATQLECSNSGFLQYSQLRANTYTITDKKLTKVDSRIIDSSLLCDFDGYITPIF